MTAALSCLSAPHPANAAEITRVGQWVGSGFYPVYRISVSGSHAYAAIQTKLRIFDISNTPNLVPVGSVNNVYEVALSGNYCYATGIGGLRVLDVSNPASPQPVGAWTNGGTYGSVAISGNYAYVAGIENAEDFSVIDISNPASPVKIAGINWAGSAGHIAVSGNYAYMAKGFNFQVVNISNPSNPVLMGAIYLTNGIGNIALSGNYAYVTLGYYGLQVIDTINPSNPVRVGGLDTPVGEITLSGNHAYCSGDNGMTVINISTPTSPVLVAETPTAFIYASSVAISGNHAYLGGFSGIQVIDISSPTNPVTIGGLTTLSHVWSVAQSGNYAYLADQYAGLQVINVSNPANPFRVGGYFDFSNPSFPFDLAVSGNHAYVLDYTNGLQVFSISNPAAPALLGACSFFTNTPRRLAVSGDKVYVTMDRGNTPNGVHYYAGMSIVDVSVPTNPVTVGTYWTTNPYAWWVQAGGVVVSNGYAYFTYGGERWDLEFGDTSVGDVQIINVSNPSNPVLAGAVGWPFLFFFESWDVAVSGGYAYGIIHYQERPPTYGEWGGVALLNVSNPNNPIWVGAAQDPGGYGVTFATSQQHSQVVLSGNHLWLLGGTPDLRAIDISNPTNMTLAASLGTGGKRIAVSDPLAYVASGYQGLQIYCLDCPRLSAELAGGQLVLKWPTNAVNFMLERAGNLAAPQWQPQSGSPQMQDGFYVLVVPATNPAAFFRLRQ